MPCIKISFLDLDATWEWLVHDIPRHLQSCLFEITGSTSASHNRGMNVTFNVAGLWADWKAMVLLTSCRLVLTFYRFYNTELYRNVVPYLAFSFV